MMLGNLSTIAQHEHDLPNSLIPSSFLRSSTLLHGHHSPARELLLPPGAADLLLPLWLTLLSLAKEACVSLSHALLQLETM